MTYDRMEDLNLFFFFSVAARLISLSGQSVQILSHSKLAYLLLSKPLPMLHIGLFMTTIQIITWLCNAPQI